eukprot:scaffold2462_cov402-Prasinococcus_capsulatus_cf.AAC.6
MDESCSLANQSSERTDVVLEVLVDRERCLHGPTAQDTQHDHFLLRRQQLNLALERVAVLVEAVVRGLGIAIALNRTCRRYFDLSKHPQVVDARQILQHQPGDKGQPRGSPQSSLVGKGPFVVAHDDDSVGARSQCRGRPGRKAQCCCTGPPWTSPCA